MKYLYRLLHFVIFCFVFFVFIAIKRAFDLFQDDVLLMLYGWFVMDFSWWFAGLFVSNKKMGKQK